MRKYALIGHNISYSLSPLIHGEIYKRMNYKASYELISLTKEQLPEFMPYLKSLDGFNITKPHKQNILPYLSGEFPKSVNTVAVRQGELYGYSTDGYGFTRDVKLHFGNISGKALVLGAGGVARVIAEELLRMGLDVYIHNRTREKAEELAEELGAKTAEIDEIKPDFVVNCTSYGFNRGENPIEGIDESGNKRILLDYENVKWAYDTIYSPPETDFLRSLKNAKTANGYGMLILQAIEADRIMCGFEIDDRLERELYESILKKIEEEKNL